MAEKAPAHKLVIAIDGLGGAGKSTLAKMLAKKYRFIHLDSGALFRSLALHAIQEGISLTDGEAIAELARRLNFRFLIRASGATYLVVNGIELGDKIREEHIGEAASKIGTLAPVREALKQVQRDIAAESSIVVEGRDAGTVIFPNAQVKFFLDASPEIRAKRRFDELVSRGKAENDLTLNKVFREMQVRDSRDSSREHAPVVQAKDALRVDTSNLSIEEVLSKLSSVIDKFLNLHTIGTNFS